MKQKIYLRVAKLRGGKTKVEANIRPVNTPLHTTGYNQTFYPTVSFCVEVDIPDQLFNRAETVVARLNIKESQAGITGEVADLQEQG